VSFAGTSKALLAGLTRAQLTVGKWSYSLKRTPKVPKRFSQLERLVAFGIGLN
jgi:hypothetical protein